jgi:hypothetical protein
VTLLKQRSPKQDLLADVGSVRRQCRRYYPNWRDLSCSCRLARMHHARRAQPARCICRR